MNKILPANSPHVAVILLWYPLFTQPFIFREVENLAHNIPVEIYTLYGRNLKNCSNEMRKAARRGRTYGTKKLLFLCKNLALAFIKNPLKICKLIKQTLFYKWPSLEVFGENAWAFLVGVTLAQQLQNDGMDMIFAPWPRGTATAALVASSLSGIPFGIAARGDNLDPADPDLADKMKQAKFIRANNAADQKRIAELFPAAQNKINLVYNSLTLPESSDTQATRFTSDTLSLLAIGRFDVTKGFDVLLDACAILKKRNVPFHLTLAGGGGKLMGLGDLDSHLRNLCKKLNLEGEVSFPGLISHDKLPQLLSSHDIFLAPCVIHESGRRDGIPNTVIEALASGIPVITTDINALPEVVKNGETGLSVAQKDPIALADAIIAMRENPLKAREMAKNGAKLAAAMFNPQANSQRLANIFKQCAE